MMIHLISLFNIAFQHSAKYGMIPSILFSLSFPKSTALTDEYKISSMDGEFTMEVFREGQEVQIAVHFRDVTQYSYAVIEKSDDVKNEFRQCGYIDMKEEKAKDGAIEKRDKYPRVYSESYYRLRTVTKEGVERTYPAVGLPPKTQ